MTYQELNKRKADLHNKRKAMLHMNYDRYTMKDLLIEIASLSNRKYDLEIENETTILCLCTPYEVKRYIELRDYDQVNTIEELLKKW